jgi:hypothetical protein
MISLFTRFLFIHYDHHHRVGSARISYSHLKRRAVLVGYDPLLNNLIFTWIHVKLNSECLHTEGPNAMKRKGN